MCIDHQMTLAASHPLATVVAALATRFAGAGGLTIDNRCMRFRITAGQHPGSGAQSIIDGPPRAALTPSPEVILHALPRRILVRQQTPGFTTSRRSCWRGRPRRFVGARSGARIASTSLRSVSSHRAVMPLQMGTTRFSRHPLALLALLAQYRLAYHLPIGEPSRRLSRDVTLTEYSH